jgi:ribosomal protein S18 acetylase RimI-like enzyme
MELRELTEGDAAIYWPLRLRALREEPEAFGASYEDAQSRPLADMVERLSAARQNGDFTLGAFNAERLAGVVTFVRASGRKNRHIASIYAMYVASEARGAGYGRALMTSLIARARALDGLEQLKLAVVTTNTTARALYLSLGFEVYGVQRKALKLDDGRYMDEELMALWLC